MDADNDKDPGLPFTIPDFYAPSTWLRDIQQSPGLLFSGLRLDG